MRRVFSCELARSRPPFSRSRPALAPGFHLPFFALCRKYDQILFSPNAATNAAPLPPPTRRRGRPRSTPTVDNDQPDDVKPQLNPRSAPKKWICSVCEAEIAKQSAQFCNVCHASRSGAPAPVSERIPVDIEGRRIVYVAIDMDTTGLNPCFEHIVKERFFWIPQYNLVFNEVQICAKPFKAPLKDAFMELVYTPRKIPFGASRVSGISAAKLKGKEDAGVVIQRLLDYLTKLTISQNDIVALVSHYGFGFEFTLLLFEMMRHNISWGRLKTLNVHFIDTFEVFKSLEHSSPLKLSSIYEKYLDRKFPASSLHRDCLAIEELCLAPSVASHFKSSEFLMSPYYMIDHVLHFRAHEIDTIELQEVNSIPWKLTDAEIVAIHHLLQAVPSDGEIVFRGVPYAISKNQDGMKTVRVYGVQFVEKQSRGQRVTLVGRTRGEGGRFVWDIVAGNSVLQRNAPEDAAGKD